MAKLTFTDDIFFGSISEISAALAKKEFSTVELTRAFCDRLEKLGPRYNALALSLRETALRKAKDVDRDFKIDRIRSPLQGIPYGAKDLLAVKDKPTTWGAKPFAGQVFKEDARVIELLDKAGAILIGKLSMVDWPAAAEIGTHPRRLTGPCLNPWDRTRWSGGSSSGSGIATAAGWSCSPSVRKPADRSSPPAPSAASPACAPLMDSSAGAERWRFPGRSIKSARCAAPPKTAAWSCKRSPAATTTTPARPARAFHTPAVRAQAEELTIGYAPVDFEESGRRPRARFSDPPWEW